MVELVTQPVQPPDLNINDLVFLSSLKARLWGMSACSIDELVEAIFKQSAEHDGYTLKRACQILFKVYCKTVRRLDNTDFSADHTGVAARQRAGTFERVGKHDEDGIYKLTYFGVSLASCLSELPRQFPEGNGLPFQGGVVVVSTEHVGGRSLT